MRYWLLRRPPHYTDIHPTYANTPWDYDKVFVNARLKAGDIVYLTAAYDELYGWGHVNKRESYQDNELQRRAYKVTVTRPVVEQNLITADDLRCLPELAGLFSNSDLNLVELKASEANSFNGLLRAKGVVAPPDMEVNDSEAQTLPNISFPRLLLAPEVTVWLNAAYARFKAGRKVEPDEMLVELWGKIPEEFDYRSIDKRLMKFGLELTLLGILHVDPSTQLPGQTDQVIRFVRELIVRNPSIKDVTAEEVSEGLELQESRVASIFNLIQHLGQFWNGAAGHADIPGYSSITIKDEQVKREYLRYKSLELLLERFYKAGEPKQEFAYHASEPSFQTPSPSLPQKMLNNSPHEVSRLRSSIDHKVIERTSTWDVFISHASENKKSVVRPLVAELTKRGVKVWYDDFALTVGDSLRRSIDHGLANSRFGIVILSHAFFSKEWPQTELDGLAARQAQGHKVILPVWHEINKEDVLRYSPTLADRLAVNTSIGIESVVDKLLEAIAPDREASRDESPTLGFSNDLWLDPVSIKVVMNALVSGSETIQIDWPRSTGALIETVGSLAKELQEYKQPTSNFHRSPPEWVAGAYQMGNGFYQDARRLQRSVPVRVPLLWKGMRAYWGNISPSFEEALRNYLALSNLTIQLKLALFLNANFPDKRSIIPPHLAGWLDIAWAHPRKVFECLFEKDEPTYAAEIHRVANVNFNHYVYGPKSKVVEAYFDNMFPPNPIINGWFVQHLIPQIELIVTEGWTELDCVVEYSEEARINKIRDEHDEEIRYDPRPI